MPRSSQPDESDPETETTLSTPDLRLLQPDGPVCIHHWVLSEPHAGQIVGGCRRCGASKVFPSSLESTERFDDYRELTADASYREELRSA